jgi:polyisoprenyl-phosphate glycosyltransferase
MVKMEGLLPPVANGCAMDARVTALIKDGGKTVFVSPRIRLSLVLPCFNEGPNLPRLIEDYRAAFRNTDGVEIILVDNGSTDDTRQVVEALRRDLLFQVVRLEKNAGYGGGIWAGLRSARGEAVGWSHADHQCPAEDVLRAFQSHLLSENPTTFVKGVRVNTRGVAGFFSILHSFCASMILGKRMWEINAQPKLFPRRLLDSLQAPPQGFEFDTYVYYVAVRQKYRVVTIPVEFLRRKHGKSNWSASASSRVRFMYGQFVYLLRLRRDEVFRALHNKEPLAGRRWLPN